jgi:hypothetical protein
MRLVGSFRRVKKKGQKGLKKGLKEEKKVENKMAGSDVSSIAFP